MYPFGYLDLAAMDLIVMKTPKLHASQLLRDTLDRRWKDYSGELKRCQAEFSNEAVYDLRVATGRVITVFQLLNAISPRPRLQKVIRTFEDQLKELDDLRDTQVILAEISETIQELPELEGLQKSQQNMEERILRSLRKKITSFHPAELAKRIRKTRHFIETGMDENLMPQLLQVVDDAFSVATWRLNWVDLGRPSTIQRIGSAFKVFRYLVEMIYPLLDQFPTNNLERMYRYQSLIGDIQDAEIFMVALADFFEQTPVSSIKTTRGFYGHRHGEAVAAYAREMDQLHRFWRPASSQPLPWNRTE